MAVDRTAAGELLPLSALLSQTLVAFVIEFDNAFERAMAHGTTNHGTSPGRADTPWLVSLGMWAHCMRYVPEDGIATRDLARAAGLDRERARMVIKRMSARWGYLEIDTVDSETGIGGDRVRWVRPTSAGREAQGIWEPLTDTIETRWQDRFGARFEALRIASADVISRVEEPVADYLGGPSRARRGQPSARQGHRQRQSVDGLPIWALLAKLLLVSAQDFDRVAEVPLVFSANVIRAIDRDGVRVRDLARLTGLARMGVDNQLSQLGRQGYLRLIADPSAGRVKLARLTSSGQQARDEYVARTAEIEHAWEQRFGAGSVRALRGALRSLVGSGAVADSPLAVGLEADGSGWRADVRRPDTLPHFPMVTHRGGFPDGS